ncbi:MAG: circularly permuted type 2 ATP-grasp protein, partial [Candidatus Eremiobacterota bacterium]
RLDDWMCDPLELRADSMLGVPGLVQAVRTGNVVVANALGSGWLESLALQPFLPQLCGYFLDQDLKVPTVRTWWCGDPQSLQHVLVNLKRLVVRVAFPQRTKPLFGESLSQAQLEDLRRRIQARPYAFVGQEVVSMSTAPVWTGEELEPRHLVLRAYVSAQEGSFAVLPGGLSRVARTAESLVVTMRTGGGSKDTWVVTATDAAPSPVPAPVSTLTDAEPTRGGGDVPSRAADNFFWLGRYVERAEGMVRLIRGCLNLMGDPEESPVVPLLLSLLDPEPGPPWERLCRACTDEESGLVFVLNQAQRLSSSVRDRMSVDSWRILNDLEIEPVGSERELLHQLEDLITELWAFGGMATESMSRGYGWRFLDLGRRLERAVHTTALLAGGLGRRTEWEPAMLESLLLICDSARTYRRRYPGGLQPAPVVDLLLCDESNPRSVAFQLASVDQHLEHLPHDPQRAVRSLEQRLTLASLTELRLADVVGVCAVVGSERPGLKLLLERLEDRLPAISDALGQHYLVHLAPSRQRPALTIDTPGEPKP